MLNARSGISTIQIIVTDFCLFLKISGITPRKSGLDELLIAYLKRTDQLIVFSSRSVLQRLTHITFTIPSGCSKLGPSKRTGFFRHLFSVCHSASVAVTTSAGPSLGRLWLVDIYPKSPLIGCRYQGGQQGPLLVSRPVGWNVTFKVLPLYM